MSEFALLDCSMLKLPLDTSSESPLPTRTSSPRPGRPQNGRGAKGGNTNGRAGKAPAPSSKLSVTFDGEIEPDDLVPEFIATRSRLLELERTRGTHTKNDQPDTDDNDKALEVAKLEAKLRRIETDVLFDKFIAEQQWKTKKITIEKELAAAKKELTEQPAESTEPDGSGQDKRAKDDITDEAERIAAEILAENDDGNDTDGIGGLFDSLPQHEIDAATGKTQTVINSANGVKTVVRDFGKWTGISPRRALEEACRSRSAQLYFLRYKSVRFGS